MIGTRQRIDYRTGKATILRRAAMSYDRLMQVVTEQAMQPAIVQINRGKMALAAPAILSMRELGPEDPEPIRQRRRRRRK
jgi:hypothetical protein